MADELKSVYLQNYVLIDQPLWIWQCEENSEHRGWRRDSEPRGACSYCQAQTLGEMEVQMSGKLEIPSSNDTEKD